MYNLRPKLSRKLFTAVATLAVVGLVVAGQNGRFRFEGEYGLWIQERDNRVQVHWITASSDSGFLQAYQDDRLLKEFETPLSQAHSVEFVVNERVPLTLVYGGQSDELDRHETVVDLDPQRPQAIHKNVDSVYVLGDIHGEFENLRELLTNAGLIDSELNWAAGTRHLVALGDLFDRGHNVTRTLWLLYELEMQARQSGGHVHVLLGNHEIMTMVNDLRYVSGKEDLIAKLHGADYANMFHPRRSLLGRWLASKPAILKIDGILFAHGGVDPVFTALSIEAINEKTNEYLSEDGFLYLMQDSVARTKYDRREYEHRLAFFFGDNSLFWHRGYVSTDALENDLDQVLKKFKARLHVVAHTPVKTIRSFYDGKLLAVDLLDPASEMLLIVRENKNRYQAYKCLLKGDVVPLEN